MGIDGRGAQDPPSSPWTKTMSDINDLPLPYISALAEAFDRAYADRSEEGIDREIKTLADAFPAEMQLDLSRGAFGYRFEVYSNMRDLLEATHEEAASCVLGVHFRGKAEAPALNASTLSPRAATWGAVVKSETRAAAIQELDSLDLAEGPAGVVEAVVRVVEKENGRPLNTTELTGLAMLYAKASRLFLDKAQALTDDVRVNVGPRRPLPS